MMQQKVRSKNYPFPTKAITQGRKKQDQDQDQDQEEKEKVKEK